MLWREGLGNPSTNQSAGDSADPEPGRQHHAGSGPCARPSAGWMDCVGTRQKPGCDIGVGYIVRIPSIMAMRSRWKERWHSEILRMNRSEWGEGVHKRRSFLLMRRPRPPLAAVLRSWWWRTRPASTVVIGSRLRHLPVFGGSAQDALHPCAPDGTVVAGWAARSHSPPRPDAGVVGVDGIDFWGENSPARHGQIVHAGFAAGAGRTLLHWNAEGRLHSPKRGRFPRRNNRRT